MQNPNQAVADNQDSPENLYKQTYLLLEKQQFEKVISDSDTYLNYFDGDPIQPKFELLKATAKGRLYGYQTYVDGLNQIALDYANTEEGKQAQALVNSLQTLGDSSFKSNDISKNFKVVYQFDTTNKDQITEFKKQLDSAITKISYYDLATSVDVYNTDKTFVVVHGIKSIDGAKGFAQIINEEKQKSKKITKPFFAISQDNYQTVQIHKNLDIEKNNSIFNEKIFSKSKETAALVGASIVFGTGATSDSFTTSSILSKKTNILSKLSIL